MSETDAPVGETASSPPPAPRKKRRFGVFVVLALLIFAGVGGWLWMRHQAGVSTDDAFLRADLVMVPAEVGGRVVEVAVQENQRIKAGDLLLRVDDSDYALRVKQAQSNLDAANADLKRVTDAAKATKSDAQSGKVRLADATRERDLQAGLAEGGAGVQVAVDRANTARSLAAQGVQTAAAAVAAAEDAVEAASTRVPAAEAALALAQRELGLTKVVAPVDGTISKVDLQPGELVQRGQSVFAIVPDDRYVVANFKETDLDRIHIGDPVRIEVDAYPDQELRGTVASLSPGTGSVFSLLPADNASGNFIKVVQRLPVRISLNPGDGAGMAAGLSANVTVQPSQP